LQFQSGSKQVAIRVTDSPLSEEILECEFSKKFATPTFDYISRISDPVQHIDTSRTR